MKLKQAVRIAQVKLRRWDATRYYGINLQTRTWCWINAAKNEYRGDLFPDPILTEAVIRKLRSETKKYEVIEWYNIKVLINRYNVVKDYKPKGRLWFSKEKPPVLKCNSRKKLAKAKSKARLETRLKLENKGKDHYGFKEVSNKAFGHPKRMKVFSLKERTEKRNERNHKERNYPTPSDD